MAPRQWDAYMVLHKVSREENDQAFTCVGKARTHNDKKCRIPLPWNNVVQIRSILEQMEKEDPATALANSGQLEVLVSLSLCTVYHKNKDQINCAVNKWRAALREAAATCSNHGVLDGRSSLESLKKELDDLKKDNLARANEQHVELERQKASLLATSRETKALKKDTMELRKRVEELSVQVEKTGK